MRLVEQPFSCCTAPQDGLFWGRDIKNRVQKTGGVDKSNLKWILVFSFSQN